MNKYLIIGVGAVVIILVGGALYVSNKNSGSSQIQDQTQNTNSAMPEEIRGDAMIEKVDDKIMQGALQLRAGSYKDYSPAIVVEEQKAGSSVVLFFHAPWCPYCKAADAAFKANLNKLPQGVAILKTDYDSNTELKKKYGVTYQHTFVQIDEQGNLVTKWNGGDIETLIKNYKK